MKILNLILFLLISNFCFSQKITYGKFAFETIDSVYHSGGADTVLRMVDGKMIVQALGLNPSKYERVRDTFFFSFNKNITLNESNLNYAPTTFFTFSDFKKKKVDYLIKKKSGITKQEFELKKEPIKSRNRDFKVVFYKNVRKEVAGFNCFKVELLYQTKNFEGKYILFVTDKIEYPANRISWFKNLPATLCPLYIESRGSRGSSIIQAIDFKKEKLNLKKMRKTLLKNAKEFNADEWMKQGY